MRGGQAVSSFTDPFIFSAVISLGGEDALISNNVSISILFIFSSRAVRAHWGHLVRTGVVQREYKDVSLNNIITLGTRIRIVVLRVGSNFAWLLCNLFTQSCCSPGWLQFYLVVLKLIRSLLLTWPAKDLLIASGLIDMVFKKVFSYINRASPMLTASCTPTDRPRSHNFNRAPSYLSGNSLPIDLPHSAMGRPCFHPYFQPRRRSP